MYNINNKSFTLYITLWLDKCGVCAGNNNTCIDIHGTFNSNQLKRGSRPYYYYVTTIPKGASNIEIIQPGYQDDLNYIGKVIANEWD